MGSAGSARCRGMMRDMDEAQRAAFGASVVRWRSQRGMSQGELARAAGIAENTMGRIETGQRTQRSKTAAVMEYTGVEVPEDLPADVEMAMDMLGSWLATLPKDSRRSVIRDLGTWIGSHRTTARDERMPPARPVVRRQV